MIVVCGEALIDLVQGAPYQCYCPRPGGSPANVAVGLARLGQPTEFVARLGAGRFGEVVRNHLREAGVGLALAHVAAEPTGLALVHAGEEYEFRVTGAADFGWSAGELPTALPDEARWLHAGSFSLVLPPGGARLARWWAGVRTLSGRSPLRSLDPNVRPSLVGSRDRYRSLLSRWCEAADLVRLSVEDLAWVDPGKSPADWVASVLRPPGPALVVVSEGAGGATAYTRHWSRHANAPRVEVVDTIGAGDALTAGLLAGLSQLGVISRGALEALDAEVVRAVLVHAVCVAAVTCTNAGAQPPTAQEMAGLEADLLLDC